MDVSVSGTINQKWYLKKFSGGFSPLSPPGFAYAFPPFFFWRFFRQAQKWRLGELAASFTLVL